MKYWYVFFVALFLLTPYAFGGGPKIILKLDDYKVRNNTCKGLQTLAFLKEKNVKAGFGVIATYCDATSAKVFGEYLNAKNNNGEKLFEVWNHGFDHIKPEFKDTSFEYQRKHFLMADSIIIANIGVEARTFGAPYNANDANTLKVISLIPRYKTIFFSQVKPDQASGLFNLGNRINLEVKTGMPDSAFFVTNYLAQKEKYSDYIVLQAHPPHFTPESFEQFKKVINFLLKEKCEFVLPDEYVKSVSHR